jgi:hypothetical protein
VQLKQSILEIVNEHILPMINNTSLNTKTDYNKALTAINNMKLVPALKKMLIQILKTRFTQVQIAKNNLATENSNQKGSRNKYYKKSPELAKLLLKNKKHYSHSLTTKTRFDNALQSIDKDIAKIKSKSPGSRHTLYLLKLRFRQLFQRLFNYKTTYKFLQMFKQASSLTALQKYIQPPIREQSHDLSYTEKEESTDYSKNDWRNPPLFLVAQLFQIKFILVQFYGFPTIAAACFCVKYGLITVNKKVVKKSTHLVRVAEIVRMPVLATLWTRHIFAKSLRIKLAFQKENNITQITTPNWAIVSTKLPAFIIWRLPTYDEINQLLYNTWFISFPDPLGLFFQNNPYHNHRF